METYNKSNRLLFSLLKRNQISDFYASGSNLVTVVLKIMEYSCVTVPLVYHVDLMRNPCLPINLGAYWLVDTKCGGKLQTDEINEIWIKSLVCLVNYYNSSFLVAGSYFRVTLTLLLKSHCLKTSFYLRATKFIKVFLEMLK